MTVEASYTLLTILVVATVLAAALLTLWRVPRIASLDGRKSLHTSREDTRFQRFNNGAQLSERNRRKLGSLYMMRNGSSYELVVSRPV